MEWEVGVEFYDYTEEDEPEIFEKAYLVNAWLLKNGAWGPKNGQTAGEKVLIKHWW